MVGNGRIQFVIVLDSCCISIGLVFIKDRPVSSFWVLRFRDLGVFIFEFWVLRFWSRVLRFRVLCASFSRFGCFVLWSSFSSTSFSKLPTTNPPFLLSNSKILNAFLKRFPTKMKPTECPAREKKTEERKRKFKVKTAVSLLNPKPIWKHYFLYMLELCKLIFCIWSRSRRPRTVRPVKDFVVSFSSL